MTVKESPLNRRPVRIATVAVASLLALLALGSPALAHTEIDVDNPQGGAADVTMSVTAEAESESAGIASVRMVLPTGIAPAQASLASGPSGWTITATADGFTVAGTPLPVHTDAKFVVKLAQLPPAGGVLTFKTLVTYTDGKVDRWIEEPSASNPSPPNPAPTVSVRPGAATPPPAPATSGQPSTGPAATSSAAARSGGGNGVLWLAVVAVLVVAALLAGALVLRRRRQATG